MMDHEQYRRALLVDPASTDAGLENHQAACEECRAFTERLLRFEQRLTRALNIDLPTSAQLLPFETRSGGRAKPSRWFALAATVAVAFVVAGGIWLAPRPSLAADVVAHMAGEPDAWNTHETVPAGKLASVLTRANMTLDPQAPSVSYASSCEFRGYVVPHLVVQSAHGPVTVMVLVHEPVSHTRQFDEQGYRGTIVPLPRHGSIAVLMRTSGSTAADIDAVAAQVRNAIVWNRDARRSLD
ncbi:MAG: DUF3379 domain-containing protein [Pseudomonadota bacterium]|nr:DUF3379 domain-containing protein [Pseudomonadota bacterium]